MASIKVKDKKVRILPFLFLNCYGILVMSGKRLKRRESLITFKNSLVLEEQYKVVQNEENN